jgi:hypothetical protein
MEDIDTILNNCQEFSSLALMDREPKSLAIVDTLSQATVVPDTHSPNPMWEKLLLHSSRAGSPDRAKSEPSVQSDSPLGHKRAGDCSCEAECSNHPRKRMHFGIIISGNGRNND